MAVAASQDQTPLYIVPNECFIEGGGSFVITANRILPTGSYLVKFGDYGNCRASGSGYDSLHGLEKIPAARRGGTHVITVKVCDETEERCIGQCTLEYKDYLAEQIVEQISKSATRSLDESSDRSDNSFSGSTNKISSDATDGERFNTLKRVPIDTPMLVYLCDEMAKRGDEHFFRALNRLGLMGEVLENRCKYFKDVATTARQHGHSELATAIETSPRDQPHDSAIKTLTFGDLLDAVHTERSLANFEPYLIEPQNDFALIISNQNFRGETSEGVNLVERRGSGTDMKRMEGIMKEFGYKVVILKDLEAEKIIENVQKMVKKINNLQNSSSFVCFIGTHGDKGKIYGSDSKSIDLKEVTDAFKEDNCPCLTGKPKLFFIQAGVVNRDDDYLNDSEFRSRLDPVEPHFLIAISLAPENVSFKSEEDGTWIISALLETLTNNYKDEDVCSMLLKVNDNASKAHAKNGYKQPCQLVFTTTKIVKFPSIAGSDVPKMMSPLPMEENCLKHETEQQNKKAQLCHDDKDWCYPMDRQYNVSVIINVDCLQKKSGEESKFGSREGSANDVTKLQKLWKDLGFTVKVPEAADFKGQSILAFLQQVAKETDEKQNSSCFVCCIMTHGSIGKIYGSDDDSVDIKAILDLFKEANCPALAGKPKLFFIQACRQIPDASSAYTAAAADARENSKFVEVANPHENDFLIGYSSLPGQNSYRYESYRKLGTWYMQALVEIFQKYHKEEHVLSLMTRINKMLEHTADQSPAPVLTLTGKIYFRSSDSTLGEKQKNA